MSGGALQTYANFTKDEVCALIPKVDVEKIVGAVGDAEGSSLKGLGANCLYFAPSAQGGAVAKLEFNIFKWTAVKALTANRSGNPPPSKDCTIGGRPAICLDPYTFEDLDNDATVWVKLGGDTDPALYTSSSAGLAQAKALAELAYANLEKGP